MISIMRLCLVFAFAVAFSTHSMAAKQWFADVTDTSGVDLVHFNGMSGELHFAEMMGAGGL